MVLAMLASLPLSCPAGASCIAPFWYEPTPTIPCSFKRFRTLCITTPGVTPCALPPLAPGRWSQSRIAGRLLLPSTNRAYLSFLHHLAHTFLHHVARAFPLLPISELADVSRQLAAISPISLFQLPFSILGLACYAPNGETPCPFRRNFSKFWSARFARRRCATRRTRAASSARPAAVSIPSATK